MCALLYVHMINSRYMSHERRGRRGRRAHISGFHAQPNAAAAKGTGVGGAVRVTRPHRHLRPTAALRVHTHATSCSLAPGCALTRPVTARIAPMSLFSSSGESGSSGSAPTLLSVILPADDSARASDVCVCVRAS